ncbi:MAG TPA: hypothetical protein VEB41_03890 [Burkholderiales bacterium]|nr:hypothetical protein [Burkholderiales bacterium]
MKGARAALAAAAVALSGCQTLGTGAPRAAEKALPPAQALVALQTDPQRYRANTVERQIVAEAVEALKGGRLDRASELFNAALKLNVTSSELHLLNALTYHLMALAGDTSRYEMAEEGYRIALRFDPSSALAEYQLGLCYLDQRKYRLAQQHIARAVVAESRDPDLLLDLAVASYYARDPRIADGALKRLRQVAPHKADAPPALRAAVMTKAALNEPEAEALLGELRKQVPADEAQRLADRVGDWKEFFRTASGEQLAQGFPPPAGFPPPPVPGPIPGVPGGFPPPAPLAPTVPVVPALPGGPPQPGFPAQTPAPFAGAGPFVDDKMVVVDVVLIGTQEDARETYGINLLNGLRLQFGDPLTNTPAFGASEVNVRTFDGGPDPASAERTYTITRDVRIPSISYSLNIANALNVGNEIIAKPSLVALAGQTSEFFSGTEISAAAVSGGAGDSVSVQKEVGVKLAVRPEFLPDGKIRLQVVAQRTFLTDPSRSVVFQFRLDTTKTTVNANVVLKYGETLILSGLTERETSAGSDGVPILRDIPGINLLFAQRDFRDFRKSILILLTPRRPMYGAQSPEDRQATFDQLSEYEKAIARLEHRHRDWFLPRAVFDELREKLDRTEMLREFRSGDVRRERWDGRESHGARISRALDRVFL